MNIGIGLDFDGTLGQDNKLERTVGVEIAERLAALHGHRFERDEAAQIFDEVALADEFTEFLTLPAYEALMSAEKA
jgi:malate synthase